MGESAPSPPLLPLLDVRDLVKHFPLPHTLLDVALRRVPEGVRAVDGVSFTLNRGRTLGLVGESGCGKSTLGRCLLRLYDADRGAVLFDGVDLMKLTEAELAPYRKRMQVVFQDPYASLNPRQRVDRMLREVLDVHDIGAPSTRRRRVDELLVQVGLSPADGHKYPGEFSGGQRQRVGIARALAVEPELLDRRRAPVGPGRLDPGPDPAAPSRPARVARLDDDLHLARPSRGPVSERRGRGDVPGHHRGARAHRRAFRAGRSIPTRWRSSRPCPRWAAPGASPLRSRASLRAPCGSRQDVGSTLDAHRGGAVFPRVAARSKSSCPATWSRATSWRIAWRRARPRGAMRR